MTAATLRRRAWRHPSFVVGAVLSAVLVLAALLSLVWQPHPPAEIDMAKKLQGPSCSTGWAPTPSAATSPPTCWWARRTASWWV
jgi:hypothetical protein